MSIGMIYQASDLHKEGYQRHVAAFTEPVIYIRDHSVFIFKPVKDQPGKLLLVVKSTL